MNLNDFMAGSYKVLDVACICGSDNGGPSTSKAQSFAAGSGEKKFGDLLKEFLETEAIPSSCGEPTEGFVIGIAAGSRPTTGWIVEVVGAVQITSGIMAGTVHVAYTTVRPSSSSGQMLSFPWGAFQITGTDWARRFIFHQIHGSSVNQFRAALHVAGGDDGGTFPVPFETDGVSPPTSKNAADERRHTTEACTELIGMKLRVYHVGDMTTMEYDLNRVNIVLAPGSREIVDIEFG